MKAKHVIYFIYDNELCITRYYFTFLKHPMRLNFGNISKTEIIANAGNVGGKL